MSEFYRLAKGKLKVVDYSEDLPIVPSTQVTDLAWENDRFIRGMTSTSLNNDQSNASRFHVNDLGNPNDSKNENLEALNYFHPLVPSTEVETSLNNDTTPGPEYPVDDFLHYPDLLPEMALNEPSKTNNLLSINKINSLNLMNSGANSISSDIGVSSGLSSGQFPVRSGGSEIAYTGNTKIARAQTFIEGVFPSTRVHKQDPGIANSSSSSLFRANFANLDSIPNFGTLVNYPSDIRKNSCAIEEKRIIEPTITLSSVCSSVEEICGRPAQNLKRKYPKSEDHEGTSGDLEDESAGVVKASLAKGYTSSKRGRTAEVHNLSERRRRDRINERMRALQELVPNCNKMDKATVLDEAIEYMKTLQHQVQIMAMGAGFYVPPMMLPPHMQQIQADCMPCFSPTGQRMDWGLAMNTMARVPIMQVADFPGPSLQPDRKSTNFRPVVGTNFSSFRRLSQRDPVNTMAVEVPCCTDSSNPDDLVKNDNLWLLGNTEGCGADKQKTIQLQSKEDELFKASNRVLTNSRSSNARSGSKENNIVENTSMK